jgi:hypothetical protein
MEERLNFLLTEGEHGWWARCLEYDFVTQADTLNDLYDEIQRTVVGHVVISAQEGHRPLQQERRLERATVENWCRTLALPGEDFGLEPDHP